jgi:hypothetical protein
MMQWIHRVVDILLGFEPKDPGSNPGGSVKVMPRKNRPACFVLRYLKMKIDIPAYSSRYTGISCVDQQVVTKVGGVFYEKINYLGVL